MKLPETTIKHFIKEVLQVYEKSCYQCSFKILQDHNSPRVLTFFAWYHIENYVIETLKYSLKAYTYSEVSQVNELEVSML